MFDLRRSCPVHCVRVASSTEIDDIRKEQCATFPSRSHYHADEIPGSLGQLSNLKTLRLNVNNFRRIGEEILFSAGFHGWIPRRPWAGHMHVLGKNKIKVFNFHLCLSQLSWLLYRPSHVSLVRAPSCAGISPVEEYNMFAGGIKKSTRLSTFKTIDLRRSRPAHAPRTGCIQHLIGGRKHEQ